MYTYAKILLDNETISIITKYILSILCKCDFCIILQIKSPAEKKNNRSEGQANSLTKINA